MSTSNPPRKRPGQAVGPRTINGVALDVRSASALCGFSEKQTRALVARGLIPHRRLGGRIIFLRAELEQFLASLPGVTPHEADENRSLRYVGEVHA